LKALQVCGEVIDAEFRDQISYLITEADFKGDVHQLIDRMCRRFKEDKKECGNEIRASRTWNFYAPGICENPDKGFVDGHIKLDW